MSDVLVDANVVLDARNQNAGRHEQALRIFQRIDRGELPRARVVNYVMAEILHPLQKRFRKGVAIETLDRLQESRGFDLVNVPQGVHADGERLFRLHRGSDPPEWVDSLIAAYMLSEGLEFIYSFDDDFDTFDSITRLNTADNPLQ
jgi:predicted nucleic acid-binding protein